MSCICVLYRSVNRDNPFRVGGELRRKADLMLAESRITRSQLYIVDPDLTQSASTTHEDNADVAVCRRCLHSDQRQRPASDCLPTDWLPLCNVPSQWTRTANGDPAGGERVMESHVEPLEADGLSSTGQAVTVAVTVSPDHRKTRPCCTVS